MTEPSSGRDFLRRALQAGPHCLPLEKLELCLQESSIPGELSQHLKSCAHCRAELDLLRSFYEAPRDSAEAEAVRQIEERLRTPRAIAPIPSRSRWKEILQTRWLISAAVLMALALITVAVGLEWRQHQAPQLYTPNGGEETVLRSGKVTVTAPAGDLETVPTSIQWQAVAGAATYRVRILEVDRSELWSTSTQESGVTIPPQVQGLMAPAKSLLLQVTALDGAGRQLAESDSIRFRILQKLYGH